MSRDLTADRIRFLCHYDAETGIMRRRVATQRSPVGSVVGFDTASGYLRASIDGKLYYVHRLAWLHVYGEWPTLELDHINRNRADNRLANLRLATTSQNAANRGLSVHNTSGAKGVLWNRQYAKWMARIRVSGKETILGFFDDKNEAAMVYRAAAEQAFGDFARTNS